MARPVTLFTGQWADLPLDKLAPLAREMSYDGLELACWGDHFDVSRALSEDGYLRRQRDILEASNLECFAISNHLVGQCICDRLDERHKAVLPARIWGDGKHDHVKERAASDMQDAARAARLFGVSQVNGFTGSSIWDKVYFFPPTSPEQIDAGYEDFAQRWHPILDVFDEQEVRFGLEVHPTEIAYDIYSAQRALAAIDHRPAFGFNFDPSHLYWQFVDPVKLIEQFPERIYHVHMKDAARNLDGRTSVLASHLPFGDARRGWDFRSIGRGEINFETIIRALNRIAYRGPLSVEWEDSGMDRVAGATESAAHVRRLDFVPSSQAFDAVFGDR